MNLLSKTNGLNNFNPTFIIKATWIKMKPHFVADQVKKSKIVIINDNNSASSKIAMLLPNTMECDGSV